MGRKLLFLSLILILIEPLISRDSFSFWNSTYYEKETLEDGRIRFHSEIQVLGDTRTVEVICTPDVQDFAPSILNNARRLIPAISNYLNTAPKTRTFTITHLTDKSTARNEGHTVLVPFNYPDPKKALPIPLLYHEIDHWWFGQNPRFISEGVSSFIPLALNESGDLKLTSDEILEIKNWWGFFTPTILKDRPLGDEDITNLSGDESFSLFYQKTFKIQYLIYQELGADLYLKFLKSLKDYDSNHDFFVQPSADSQDTDGIITKLNEVKDLNWGRKLSGWIKTKGYSEISLKEWQDTDSDGLLDIEERYIRSNPKSSDTDGDGLADGAEIQIGSNPLVAESSKVITNLLADFGPVIDGNASEWSFLPAKKTVNSPANMKIPGHFDMIQFQYYWKDDFLYGALKTRDLPKVDSASNGYYFFLVDQSESAKTEGFGFWYRKDSMIGWEIRKNDTPEIVVGRLGEVFEFKIRIPKSDPTPKKYIPLIRKTDNVGIWNQYIPIEIER